MICDIPYQVFRTVQNFQKLNILLLNYAIDASPLKQIGEHIADAVVEKQIDNFKHFNQFFRSK